MLSRDWRWGVGYCRTHRFALFVFVASVWYSCLSYLLYSSYCGIHRLCVCKLLPGLSSRLPSLFSFITLSLFPTFLLHNPLSLPSATFTSLNDVRIHAGQPFSRYWRQYHVVYGASKLSESFFCRAWSPARSSHDGNHIRWNVLCFCYDAHKPAHSVCHKLASPTPARSYAHYYVVTGLNALYITLESTRYIYKAKQYTYILIVAILNIESSLLFIVFLNIDLILLYY